MQPMLLRFVFVGIMAVNAIAGYSQGATATGCKPPINRELWHLKIDREQKAILKADGRADALFAATTDDDINYLITRALVQRVDDLQCVIERDSISGSQKKIGYLKGLEILLRNFTTAYRGRRSLAASFPALINAFGEALRLDRSNYSIEPVIQRYNYDVGNALVRSGAFDENINKGNARQVLLLKYVSLYPHQTFVALKEFPEVPFRDSLILAAGRKYPRLLYDFAAANNKLGYAIRRIEDPFVQTVAKMATAGGSGQLYFPFLDNILKGTQTLQEIDAVKGDDIKYYKLLVKTRMDYVRRQLQGDTVLEMGSLTSMMENKARNVIVKEINGLHESPDAVRFRILQGLTAPELYYVAVSSESEIYTSSYTRGVYPAVMQKIGNRGDSLLMAVSFDRFKKWIRLAAGYNTLAPFLATFPNKDQSEKLMTAFVNNLERTSSLEDGVDVADSYASIAETAKPLAAKMLQNVKLNLERTSEEGNRRGQVMYNLLYKLFLSADSSANIDLSKEFGIPPVYNVPFSSLANDSGAVVMQVFFYGDKDGKMYYQDYVRQFANPGWKRSENKQWIEFKSTKGKNLMVFANKPLPEETNEDAKAQEALGDYLSGKGLTPTVVVHRGHSYYAPYTIKQIQPSTKIAFLGSCGGYHLIHDVLTHAPDAHIIASKQIGKGSINQPFFDLLNDKLRAGNNIDWVPFWREFRGRAGRIEGFDDYIPPHKNLGAIFIKAYKAQTGEDDDQG